MSGQPLDLVTKSPRHRRVALALSQLLALLQYLDCARYVAFAEECPGLAKQTGVAFSLGGVHDGMSGETVDSILGGSLRLIQPRRGYRFSVDAIVLARFIQPRPGARILELGAGCGVIAILAAALYSPREVDAVEIQHELATLIARNAALNNLPMVRAVAADLRARSIPGVAPAGFDLVIANPPYRAAGSGRRSPDAGRDLARAEATATMADFVAASARYLKHGGKAAFVFTAKRAAELISEAAK